MSATYSELDVRPMTGALGAEVHGVDLSQPLDNETFSDLHQAFVDHLVIFFRDQHLTPDQHVALARRFGPLHIHPFAVGMPGHPEVLEIIKEPEETHNWGQNWHTDVPFKERPPLGAILYAKEVPPFSGDTFFSNMYLAYETLSPGIQETLSTLTGVFFGDNSLYEGYSASIGNRKVESLTAEHPIVRTHVDSGKKSLFIDGSLKQFKGWTAEESQPLITSLREHAVRPQFTCRFRWQENSVAFWDNRCTLHHANNDYFYKLRDFAPTRRVMHRVAVVGERPH